MSKIDVQNDVNPDLVETKTTILDQAFHRSGKNDEDSISRLITGLSKTLGSLDEYDEIESLLEEATNRLAKRWKARDEQSEAAFQGLLVVLEHCLSMPLQLHTSFEIFVSVLGYQSVSFWRRAVPCVFESDLSTGTKYRDALLFSLALYDVNNGQNRLRELYAAVPGVRQSLLGVHAKRFCEKYSHLQKQRSRASSRGASVENLASLAFDEDDGQLDEEESEGVCSAGGLADTTHHKQRVINVSNAPPVSLTRKLSGQWEIKQGSGGLVSCVDPVMSEDKENVWLANIGLNVAPPDSSGTNTPAHDEPLLPSTNSIGLQLIRRAEAREVFHVLEDDDHFDEKQHNIQQDMSLLRLLHAYNKTNYQLNPVIVSQEDYNTYYGGISNGLLWPALHNLGEYIVHEYDDPLILREHWTAYVRVNYQFALDAVRNSRPQDFIWIHDYHLLLTGQIMRGLDSDLEVGFFLHIPFQLPDDFFDKYRIVAEPILRAILRFAKVGFQTHRDRAKYLEMVKTNIPRVRVKFDAKVDIFTATHEGWTCSLGVFPVSIKNEDFLAIVQAPETAVLAEEIRKNVMACSAPDGRLFFSVERFDYTKGIREKLRAFRRYFDVHPERQGRDVLFQVAVINRRSVKSYRQYQDDCHALVSRINQEVHCEDWPEWKPVHFQTEGQLIGSFAV